MIITISPFQKYCEICPSHRIKIFICSSVGTDLNEVLSYTPGSLVNRGVCLTGNFNFLHNFPPTKINLKRKLSLISFFDLQPYKRLNIKQTSDENIEKYQLRAYQSILFQNLKINIIRVVWQRIRRVTIEILAVKRLRFTCLINNQRKIKIPC